MDQEPSTTPLAFVVGQNCKRIRTAADVTLNDLAKQARGVGLRWTASKVGQFERGQNAPTFSTVLALSIALSAATSRDVVPADLVEFDGFIEFNDAWKITGSKVVAALHGEPWGVIRAGDVGMKVDTKLIADAFASFSKGPARYHDLLIRDIDSVITRSGLDEQRLAKRLDVDGHLLAEASAYLWGRSFSDERDRLAGPDANPQKRGRVARELQKQIAEELTRGDD